MALGAARLLLPGTMPVALFQFHVRPIQSAKSPTSTQSTSNSAPTRLTQSPRSAAPTAESKAKTQRYTKSSRNFFVYRGMEWESQWATSHRQRVQVGRADV